MQFWHSKLESGGSDNVVCLAKYELTLKNLELFSVKE